MTSSKYILSLELNLTEMMDVGMLGKKGESIEKVGSACHLPYAGGTGH